jgi:hypothetical protein
MLLGVSKNTKCNAFDIGPQRLPLRFKIPDVASLIERNLKKLALSEYVINCVILSLHVPTSSDSYDQAFSLTV